MLTLETSLTQELIPLTKSSIARLSTNYDQVFVLDEFGILTLTGVDSAKFLQGQLTCDVLGLLDSHATLGAYCTIKGKVTSIFYLLKENINTIHLLIPKIIITEVFKDLNKYAIFSKISIKQDEESIVLAAHADIAKLLNQEGSHKIQDTAFNLEFILYPSNKLDNLVTLSNQKKISLLSCTCWSYLEIQSGIARITNVNTQKYFPHDLSLEKVNAVSFKKGCYRGQEIIARMEFRGNIKRSLYKIKLTTINDLDLKSMQENQHAIEYDSKGIGNLVSIVKVENDTYLGLAVINDAAVYDSWDNQCPLTLHATNATVEVLKASHPR